MRLSLEEVVRKYRNSLYAAALSASQLPADAEDAVQEALITYYTDSREFKDESQLKYWLIRITVNKAHDLRRRFRGKWDVSWEEYIQSVDFESPKQRSLVTEVLQLFATMSSEEFNNRYRNVQASEIFVSCDYC